MPEQWSLEVGIKETNQVEATKNVLQKSNEKQMKLRLQ